MIRQMPHGDDRRALQQCALVHGRGSGRSSFAFLSDVKAIERSGEHGGEGLIVFRRMLEGASFDAAVDFLDVTSIPPGSTIGTHDHVDSEEIYVVLDGEPLIDVQGIERRLCRGDVAVVHPGGRHALRNDTDHDVTIAVIQLRPSSR